MAIHQFRFGSRELHGSLSQGKQPGGLVSVKASENNERRPGLVRELVDAMASMA